MVTDGGNSRNEIMKSNTEQKMKLGWLHKARSALTAFERNSEWWWVQYIYIWYIIDDMYIDDIYIYGYIYMIII